MLALSKLQKIFLKLKYLEVLQREIKVNGLGKEYFSTVYADERDRSYKNSMKH
jgi:hypothetical protein